MLSRASQGQGSPPPSEHLTVNVQRRQRHPGELAGAASTALSSRCMQRKEEFDLEVK